MPDRPEPRPRDTVFRGTLQQVQDHFERNLWTDGLPVIPPTIESIEKFLRFTDRSPGEVVGICLPEYREATIWNIAVNGVMAGCRPEYMPVLIAIVEAVTDPKYRLEDAGSTPGWEPLIIVSGPIIRQLNFNYGGGVMRAGRRANTSIGRFLRLYVRNVAGQRIPAGGTDEASSLRFGGTDKAAIGLSPLVVLAENEDAVREIGWSTFGNDRGFGDLDSVVTVQSVVAVTMPVYTAGSDARNHVQIISEVIGQTFAYWSWAGMLHDAFHPLIVMSPSVAKAIANCGWGKRDIRKYLYANTKVQAERVERYARNAAFNSFDLKNMVEQGALPRDYHASDDPGRLLPVFYKEECINFVVAGDPGRNQSKGYIQNHEQGVPTSKEIRLPANWRQLLDQGG